MAIANPRIHIICWICWSNKDMKYEIIWICDADLNEKDWVSIRCDNCSSVTWLDEIIKEV